MRQTDEELKEILKYEGYKEGSRKYQLELYKRKIISCQVVKKVVRCSDCFYSDECPLLRDYLNAKESK